MIKFEVIAVILLFVFVVFYVAQQVLPNLLR